MSHTRRPRYLEFGLHGIHYFALSFSLLGFTPAPQGVPSGIAGGLTATCRVTGSASTSGTSAIVWQVLDYGTALLDPYTRSNNYGPAGNSK